MARSARWLDQRFWLYVDSLSVCHTKNNTTDRRGDRGARRTCASAGESAPAVGVLLVLLTKGKDNEGQGQGHGRAADGKRAAVVVVGAAVAVRPPLTACATNPAMGSALPPSSLARRWQ